MAKLKTTDDLMAEARTVTRNNSTENLITTEEIIKIIRQKYYDIFIKRKRKSRKEKNRHD
jgi:hypothetical protein